LEANDLTHEGLGGKEIDNLPEKLLVGTALAG